MCLVKSVYATKVIAWKNPAEKITIPKHVSKGELMKTQQSPQLQWVIIGYIHAAIVCAW